MNHNRKQQPTMIETAEELERLASLLGGEKVIACDLEADSLHHYREKVCLIQLATSREVFLVDPLALHDISPLAPVFSDPKLRKVFHGADYDIRSLFRDFSLQVNNLFDTMIACQLLGEKEIGLAAVLKKRFDVDLDKRYQKADWSKRPLDEGMVAYAAADTALLVALYRQLEKELAECGRLSWVEEECHLLSGVRAADREGEPFYARFKGASRMDRRTLAVLEELLRFRDTKACHADRPPFKILGNETIRELAEKKPGTLADLAGISGLPPRSVDRFGRDILKAVASGCSLPESRLPRILHPPRPERDPDREERLKRLKRWRERKAKSLGIEAGVLVNNALLETLTKEMPSDRNGLDDVPALRQWQKRELGDEILNELR